jgi:hypothetical protein
MKLPKEKMNQLMLVGVGTVAMLAAIYFFLIQTQYRSLLQVRQQISESQKKLQNIKDTIKHSDTVEADLIDASTSLSRAEEDMASGDIYAWTVDLFRRLKTQYQNVDIPQINQPEIGDVDLLPNFPYKQMRVTVTGTAYYHDLGKFIAGFENNFPHIRLVNLTLQPASAGTGSEKLSFSMDVVALIKPNSTLSK